MMYFLFNSPFSTQYCLAVLIHASIASDPASINACPLSPNQMRNKLTRIQESSRLKPPFPTKKLRQLIPSPIPQTLMISISHLPSLFRHDLHDLFIPTSEACDCRTAGDAIEDGSTVVEGVVQT